jgi:hypothetical protein
MRNDFFILFRLVLVEFLPENLIDLTEIQGFMR